MAQVDPSLTDFRTKRTPAAADAPELSRITFGRAPAPYAPRGQIVTDLPTALRDAQLVLRRSERTKYPEHAVSYTVDIPGAADFIRIPSVESLELKRERIKRMQTARSPLPEGLRWLPYVINKLDDAQDILYTALAIGTPFIVRLAPRFIPVVGWLVVGNDVLNIATGTLALGLNGGNAKRRGKAILDLATGSMTKRFRAFTGTARSTYRAQATVRDKLRAASADFVKNTKWGPFLIQGGQAMESLTGYGLILGPFMGMVTDQLWGAVELARGNQIVYRGPPPSDPAAKAVRYLTTNSNTNEVRDLLTPEDHALLCAADCVAMQWLTERAVSSDPTARFERALAAVPPTLTTWHTASRLALIEAGFDPDQAPDPPLAAGAYAPTLRDALDRQAAEEIPFTHAMHREFASRPLGQWAQMAHSQAGELGITEYVTDGVELAYVPTYAERIVLAMIEHNRFPLFWQSHFRAAELIDSGRLALYQQTFNPAGSFDAYLNDTAEKLTADLLDWPTRAFLEAQLQDHFGGWQTRP